MHRLGCRLPERFGAPDFIRKEIVSGGNLPASSEIPHHCLREYFNELSCQGAD